MGAWDIRAVWEMGWVSVQFEVEGAGWSRSTRVRVRKGVQESGDVWLGF